MKGSREHAFKGQLEWLRPHIIASMEKRAQLLQLKAKAEGEAAVPPPKKRGRPRTRKVLPPDQLYMGYINEIAWTNAKKNRPKDF